MQETLNFYRIFIVILLKLQFQKSLATFLIDEKKLKLDLFLYDVYTFFLYRRSRVEEFLECMDLFFILKFKSKTIIYPNILSEDRMDDINNINFHYLYIW